MDIQSVVLGRYNFSGNYKAGCYVYTSGKYKDKNDRIPIKLGEDPSSFPDRKQVCNAKGSMSCAAISARGVCSGGSVIDETAANNPAEKERF